MLILAALILLASGFLIGSELQAARNESEIKHLKSQLSNDANGTVKRGERGRFVSAKA